MKVSDSQIIYASQNSRSAAEAARMLGINYKTYRRRAEELGVFKTNQSLAGVSKPHARKHNINDDVFKVLDREGAYWLGFLAADGSVVDNKLKVVLKGEDKGHLVNMMKYMKSTYPVNDHTAYYTDENGKHEFPACNVHITSNEIVNTLKNYGIVQGKKYLDIDFLSYIPNEFKLDFIVGFFDGDGSVTTYTNKRQVCTIACNKRLAVSIKFILNMFDIDINVSERDAITVLSWTNEKSMYIFKQIYNDGSMVYPVLKRKLKQLKL